MTFQNQLQKAREEYKETGEMDSKRACILLNCQTAIQYFQSKKIIEKLWELELDSLIISNTIKIIKRIEKQFGIGKFLNYKTICAIAFYYACIYYNKRITQKEVSNLFNCKIDHSFRTLNKKIKKNKLMIFRE